MEKNYRIIEFTPGCNIESAVKELKEQDDLVYGTFNGQMLYSDIDDMDSAYKKITGKTKAEFDEAAIKRQQEYEKEKQEHKEAIPKLTEEWILKGKAILDKKYHGIWVEIVPIRLGDLYRGMELSASLDVIKELNNDCELETAKVIFEKQGHSGMSASLVLSMVRELCSRGVDFVEYTDK